MVWIQFIMCAGVIIAAGARLTRDADLLSERLNLGKVWIGVVLLGVVTSLPEAIASITSVVTLNAPDLAVGNLIGSNNFNPLLIMMMDLMYRNCAVTNQIKPSKSHDSAMIFAIMLTALAIAMIGARNIPANVAIGPTDAGTCLILVFYTWGMWDLAGKGEVEPVVKESPISLGKLCASLFVSAILVVVSASWLASICDTIAVTTGWGRTFVGSILLACVTSLPEMVVTVAAIKISAFDLAIGNIFGSNMTNMFILFVTDLFYSPGPILSVVSPTHILTGCFSIGMTLIVMAGIRIRNKKTYFGLGMDSICLIILFLIGTGILYRLR
jgi:cation:H+ antiporter